MQIVIEIPQDVYDKALSGDGTGTIWAGYVKNGIPLDKIRAEIEQLTSRYSISKERGGMGIVEWSDRLIEESDVLQVIDKYKADKEDKE